MFDRLHQHHSSGTFSQLLVIQKLDRISIQVGGEVKILDQTWEGIKVWTGPFLLGGGIRNRKSPNMASNFGLRRQREWTPIQPQYNGGFQAIKLLEALTWAEIRLKS